MRFTIREIEAKCTFSSALTIEALSRVIPDDAIRQVIAREGVTEQRERRLTAALTLWLVIALHLFPTVSISGVFRKLVRGARLLWPDPEVPLPGDSALAYRRQQVGARPLVALFKRVCRLIATPQTRGAFLFGLRLMAIDGTSEDVPDTPANAKAFGRHAGARGARAFPQLQGVYLVECGTHAVVDAGFWPCHTSERVGGFRLLRSVARGMLVLWDRGFHDFDMVRATRQRGAHVLSRLPASVKPLPLRSLPDGSLLAYLLPSDDARRRRGVRILVRVITYTITDPALPGYGETHRVLTTLLNPRLAPAHDLACGYHERWEIEIVIDEIDTHQRLVGRTLRSLTPMGVIQELYGAAGPLRGARADASGGAAGGCGPGSLEFRACAGNRAGRRAGISVGRAERASGALRPHAARNRGQTIARAARTHEWPSGQAQDVELQAETRRASPAAQAAGELPGCGGRAAPTAAGHATQTIDRASGRRKSDRQPCIRPYLKGIAPSPRLPSPVSLNTVAREVVPFGTRSNMADVPSAVPEKFSSATSRIRPLMPV